MNIICVPAKDLKDYESHCFQNNLKYVPRVGEHVMVNNVMIEWYESKNLNPYLTVVSVLHTENGVIVNLDNKS